MMFLWFSEKYSSSGFGIKITFKFFDNQIYLQLKMRFAKVTNLLLFKQGYNQLSLVVHLQQN